MSRWLWMPVLVVWTGLLAHGQEQPSAARSSILTGRVVAEADERPLSGVSVEVVGSPASPGPAALTDSFGQFSVGPVPIPRASAVIMRKAGFIVLRAAITPGDTPIFRLQEHAVLSGRVVDDVGEEVIGATITARRAGGGASYTTATDDRGEYRLSVPPDEPLVLLVETTGVESPGRVRGPNQLAFAPPEHTLYFPGTPTAERAEVVRLRAGESRAGMDFSVPTEQSVRQPFRGLESISTFVSDISIADVPGDATGVVQGRVGDTGGRGLANAVVLLANERAGSLVRMVRTDAAGNFEFPQVPAGWFRVMASKPGYAPADARPTMADGQTRPTQVALRLTPWASLSGRVINEFGEPVQNARVQVMSMRSVQGRRMLAFAASVDPLTDERGAYRVYGLEPGTYVISAELADDGAGGSSIRRAFYGSAGPTGATLLTIAEGQDSSGLDIVLMPSPAYRVAGRVLNAAGQPGFRGGVTLFPSQRARSMISVPVSAQVGEDGRFEFKNVRDGDYVVQAYRGRVNSTTEGEFGSVGVAVSGGDVTDMVLTTSGGSSVSGVVVFEAMDPSRQPPRAGVELSAVPSDLDAAPGNWARAGVDPEWRFSFAGISGPRRLIPTQLPEGWGLKAVRVNGADVGDRPMRFGSVGESLTDVQVVLTDTPTALMGRVTDVRGAGVARLPMLVFSTEAGQWYPFSLRLRRSVTRNDGTFLVSGLPPGTYYVVAAPAGDEDWQSPETLDALSSQASVVSLSEGQRVSVVIRR